jgi:hypothetical protein
MSDTTEEQQQTIAPRLPTNGGYRPGAGRPPKPKGEPNAVRPLALRPISEQLMPILNAQFIDMSMIDIMMWAARVEAANGNWRSAAQMAALVAPYLHPRLSQTESTTTIKTDSTTLSTEELNSMVANWTEVRVQNQQKVIDNDPTIAIPSKPMVKMKPRKVKPSTTPAKGKKP